MEIRLKELCQKKGTTQKDLALKLGVTEMTLSRAAKGNTSLPLLERVGTFRPSTNKYNNLPEMRDSVRSQRKNLSRKPNK